MRKGFRPNVDVYRTSDGPAQFVVVVELAGVAPEHLQLEVAERLLVIAGERRRPPADGRPSYQQVEVEWGPFERRLRLPEDVDPAAAEARYERGFLTIRLPIAAKPPDPVRVAITVRMVT
jgi:HSP20 family protein